MSYRLQSRKKKIFPWGKILFAIVFSFILVFIFKSLIIRSVDTVRNVAHETMLFFLPQSFISHVGLVQENQELRAQVMLLTAENADKVRIQNELSSLKKIGDKKPDPHYFETNTHILSRPGEAPYDILVVDRGSESGVRVDDRAIYGSLILGNVVEVGSGYSKIKLLSSPDNVIKGTLGEKKTTIDVKGVGGGAFESLLPIGASVSVGDSIVLPTYSSKIFAVVENVEELKAEGFKKIRFVLPVNVNHITDITLTGTR